jgi:hypothetical protein
MRRLRRGIEILRSQGPRSLLWHSFNHLDVWHPLWNTGTSRYPIGTNVFDREWDVLVVLDACRVDSLRGMSNEYDWIQDVESTRSVGSMSPEWMLQTFSEARREDIQDTALVAANIWASRIFDERYHKKGTHDHDVIHKGRPAWKPVPKDAFGYFEQVYPIDHQNDRLHPKGQIPHITTDRAIAVGREQDFDRLIVHYGLPHLPLIADAIDWSPGELSTSELMSGPKATRDLHPFEQTFGPAQNDEIPASQARELFNRNLRLGLEYVEILLSNIDAETVAITADHGEGFGENGVWNHPFGYPFSPIKTVPWTETTATDTGSYESRFEPLDRSINEQERVEFLKDMGYL